MVKADLIQRIVLQNPELSKEDSRRLVDAFYDAMIEQLSRGDAIELRGFGRFAVKRYGDRAIHNPRTGEISSKQHIVSVKFRTGRSLHALLNHT